MSVCERKTEENRGIVRSKPALGCVRQIEIQRAKTSREKKKKSISEMCTWMQRYGEKMGKESFRKGGRRVQTLGIKIQREKNPKAETDTLRCRREQKIDM